MPSASTIFVGLPEQLTTGAVMTAAKGTTLPASADAALTGFTGSGYVTEDGIQVSPTWNTNKLHEWSGAAVRTLLESFEGQITFSLMNLLDEESAKQAFGAAMVTKTAATAAHGTQLKIKMGGTLPEEKVWVFKMKDGDAKVLVCVPRGQVAAIDAIEFNRNNSANISVTLDCLHDDTAGCSIVILTDDGVATA